MTKGSALEKNVGSLTESVGFIVKNMATKEDVAKLSTRIDRAEQGLGQRIDSISNRLDYELDRRKQLEVRVSRLERKA